MTSLDEACRRLFGDRLGEPRLPERFADTVVTERVADAQPESSQLVRRAVDPAGGSEQRETAVAEVETALLEASKELEFARAEPLEPSAVDDTFGPTLGDPAEIDVSLPPPIGALGVPVVLRLQDRKPTRVPFPLLESADRVGVLERIDEQVLLEVLDEIASGAQSRLFQAARRRRKPGNMRSRNSSAAARASARGSVTVVTGTSMSDMGRVL